MNNKELLKEKILFNILDIRYNEIVEENSLRAEEKNIYPTYWFSTDNYKIKIEILVEAIKKKCLIEETTSYLKIEEGINREER